MDFNFIILLSLYATVLGRVGRINDEFRRWINSYAHACKDEERGKLDELHVGGKRDTNLSGLTEDHVSKPLSPNLQLRTHISTSHRPENGGEVE